jgi:hypothetical protein
MELDPSRPLANAQALPDWERRNGMGLFRAIFRTIAQVALRPGQTFRSMSDTDNVREAVLFGWAISAIVVFIPGLVNIAISSLFLDSTFNTLLDQAGGSSDMMVWYERFRAYQFPILILGATLGQLFQIFFMAAFCHFSLWVYRTANVPFGSTLKVAAYSHGATICLSLVPCIGTLLQLGWECWCLVEGLAARHRITRGRVTWILSIVSLIPALIVLVIVLAWLWTRWDPLLATLE